MIGNRTPEMKSCDALNIAANDVGYQTINEYKTKRK